MKILLLSTHFNTGGISSYLLTLAGGLKKSGHDVIIGSSGGNLVASLPGLGIHHLTLHIRTKSELDPRLYLAALQLRKFIRQEKIELVHANTRVTQVIGRLLLKYSDCAYVSTAHGFFKPKLARRIFQCWGQFVIAISEPVRQHLIDDLQVKREKTVLIRNGLDIEQFPVVSPEAKEKLRTEFQLGAGPVIGIIARLSDVKGHEFLIQAMPAVLREFPQAKLLIVGEGPREKFLKNLVSQFCLTESIRFYPVVNQTHRMLQLLDCFVLPSLQEGLGLSVMEAQASGLPVVASKVGGIPSLIDDGQTGLLVPPGNPKILAEGILILIRHKDQARAMGAKARAAIGRDFSAQSMVAQTLKLYQQAVSLRSSQ